MKRPDYMRLSSTNEYTINYARVRTARRFFHALGLSEYDGNTLLIHTKGTMETQFSEPPVTCNDANDCYKYGSGRRN